MDNIGALVEKFADIKEKYGNNYPIILYEPAIECQEKKKLKGLIEKNKSINLFAKFGNAFKFVHSLGISFILIVSKHCDEQHILRNFEHLGNIFGRVMLDFEEEALLKDLFTEISDLKRKSLKVYVFCTLLDCMTEAVRKEEEEVMVICDIKDIAKEFHQEFIIIWFDPKRTSEGKQKLEKEIDVRIEEENTYTEFAKMYERLKDYKGTPYHLVVSSCDETEKIIKEMDKFQNLLGLYIYGKDFKNKIENKKVEIRSTLEELVPRIKEGFRTKSKVNNSLPAFATNFDSPDRTGLFKLHYYLEGFVNFENRKQAKEDFIQLAWKIYQDTSLDLLEFEKDYDEYNQKKILWWYTKDLPIYRLINNCLRISSPDSILSCRFVLKDLERAIREEYQQKSKDFNGIVYRGAFVSKDEWKQLVGNIGKEIEMYGFLSTSVNQATAIKFLRVDPKNKILIKIIIPPLPELDEQGFADISEISEHKGEKEVLFNIRSKFQILETGVIKIDSKGTTCRHLVLLYGAQLLRRYMTKIKPSINIELELPSEIKCNFCGSVENLFGFKQDRTVVNCLECLIKRSLPKDTPLVALDAKNEKGVIKTFSGKILTPKEGVITFSNSGYKCHYCEAKGKDKYYKWMSCDGKDVVVQCSECLEIKKIVGENKILMSETRPYSMWQESQKEWEVISSDYQEKKSHRTESENIGHVYIQTENNEKCVDYGKRALTNILRKRRRETFKASIFETLGEAYMRLGEHQQELKCLENCLGLTKLRREEKHPSGIVLYSNIASAHYHLARHHKALEYYNRALDIQKPFFLEQHPVNANLYTGLASVYSSLGEHENALRYFTKAINIQESVFGKKHPETASGYTSIALFYRGLGKNQEALEYFNRTLEVYESIYGEKNSHTAGSYANIASVYPDLGNYPKAIEFFKKAIDILKSIYGAKHPDVATSYNNLAKVYQTLGQSQEALQYFNMASDIFTTFHGEKHSSTAFSLNNIGTVHLSSGQYLEAKKYFERALDRRKSIFGEEHPEVAVSYTSIGAVYKALGDHNKALEDFEKALNLQKLIFSGPHPDKGTSYNNIAMIYETLGQYQKALDYHKNALEMVISLYGKKHPDTARSFNNIGCVYDNLGQSSKAIKYYTKALDIRTLIFGKVHPEIAISYNNLAIAYDSLGDSQCALDYYTKALDMQKSLHKEDHPDIATVYNNLGATCMKLKEFQKAEEYFKKSLSMRKLIYAENHPDIAIVYNNLGSLYEHLNKPQKALEYYSRAMPIAELTYGETHPFTATVYDNIGSIYSTLLNHKEAIKYQKKSLRTRQSIFGENHAMVATSYNNLGLCYLASGEYLKAQDCFFTGIDMLKSLHGEKHPEMHNLYGNLSMVYDKLGDYKKRKEYVTKALNLRPA